MDVSNSLINFGAVTLYSKSTKSDAPKEKGKKAPRVWALGGCANKEVLDYSAPTTNGAPDTAPPEDINLVRENGPVRITFIKKREEVETRRAGPLVSMNKGGGLCLEFSE